MARDSIRATVVLLAVFDASGCSRQHPNALESVSLPETVEKNAAEIHKLYDPKSLKEVTLFVDLPEEVQRLANDDFMRARYDGTPTKFLVGGASKSSAIVAYEQFGFVPYFGSESYVFFNSHWSVENRREIGSEIRTLSELISATSSMK